MFGKNWMKGFQKKNNNGKNYRKNSLYIPVTTQVVFNLFKSWLNHNNRVVRVSKKYPTLLRNIKSISFAFEKN